MDDLLLLLLLIVGGGVLLVSLIGLLFGLGFRLLLLGGLLGLGLVLLLLLLGRGGDRGLLLGIVVVIAAADEGEAGGTDTGASGGSEECAPAQSLPPHSLPVVALCHGVPRSLRRPFSACAGG